MEKILEQVIVTVQTLENQTMALRVHWDSITDYSNPSNFPALLHYLADLILIFILFVFAPW